MKRYIDAFALPVPKKNKKAYQEMAEKAGKLYMEYGALQYTETVGEDMTEHPYCTSFTKKMKPKEDEMIVVAYIVFKSRKHRDEVNAKVMSDPRMCPEGMDMSTMPFDCKKMAYNGFESLVFLENSQIGAS